MTEHGELVYRTATNLGVPMSRETAENIAKALLTHVDDVCTYTTLAYRAAWEHEPFRTGTRKEMRLHLMEQILDRGYVPVAIPTETLRYMQGYMTEVPESADWGRIEVKLSVGVRRA